MNNNQDDNVLIGAVLGGLAITGIITTAYILTKTGKMQNLISKVQKVINNEEMIDNEE